MTDQRERWLTLRQVRARLEAADMELSDQTIRNWGDSGKLAIRRTAGGQRRFALTSVDRAIADWKASSHPPDPDPEPAAEPAASPDA